MQANTIDEVITQLEEIIQQTIIDENPMGYFAALYHHVTVTVKEGIANQYYSDGKRMEQLDVNFANRYLEAYTQFQQKQPCTQSWPYAFETTKKIWPTVLQNLLLGINAHINLDLGIAAVQTNPGKDIDALKEDFYKINAVLASLVSDVEKSMAEIWPTLTLILKRVGKMDSFLIDFSMQQARDGAWKFATELAPLNSFQQEAAIKERDKKIAEIALKVSKPGFFISTLFLMVRIGEIGSVSKKIKTLYKKQTI
jgi:hypothetical protein